MSDRRDPESVEETEFGLGAGMIDSRSRAERAIRPHQQLQEIYALPKTFDGSEAGLEGGERKAPEETPVPRLLPGETEADRA